MALVPFSPPPGINSDDTTLAAEGQWADCDRFRFRFGKAETLGAVTEKFTLAGSNACTDLFAITRGGTPTIVYGGVEEIYVGGIADGSVNDRSPASGAAGSGWSFAAWGETLLAADRGGTLFEQSGSSAATVITNAPDRIDAGIIVTPQRQVLAFATNEESSGTHNPLCIRGCDIEDYTDWTTSASNNAFEHILDGHGSIIAARLVGFHVVVWATGGVYLGEFVGDPTQTFRFDRVSAAPPPVSERAVTVMEGAAWWMGADVQMRAYTPGDLPRIVPCPISKDLRNNYVPSQTAFMVTSRDNEEVWFFYQDSRDQSATVPSRFIAYSVRESVLAQRPVWFRGSLSRSAVLDSDIVRAAVISNPPTPVLGVNEDNDVFTGEGGSASAYIQSADFVLENSGRRMMIRGIIRDFEGAAGSSTDSLLTLYVRSYPHATPVTKGPYTLLGSATKVDFRASGKLVAMKLAAVPGGTGSFRLGRILFDVVPMGER